MTSIPYGGNGQPARDVSSDHEFIELYAGTQSSFYTDLPYGENTDIPAFSVVGLAAGILALATEDGTVAALGVTMTPVVSGAGETGSAATARDGCFNPEALNWDASYDDDAKKAAAFDGAPSPTQITIQKTVG